MPRQTVDQQAKERGHESTSASPKWLAVFAALFVASLAGLMAVSFGLWRWFTPAQATPSAIVRPPAPNLQPSTSDPDLDREAMEKLNARYAQEFADRGWVAKNGDVRVPADVAAKVIAESRRDVGGAP